MGSSKKTYKIYLFLLALIILFSLILYVWKKPLSFQVFEPFDSSPAPATIFTCTTFFDFEKQDKWAVFCKAMDTIQELHSAEILSKVDRWLLVNEHSESPKQDWAKVVKEKYPFLELYQKDASQKGQAASMNYILQQIPPYTYWIHWEESWYCRSPCFMRMFDVMDATSLTQVQVTQHLDYPNWLDPGNHTKETNTTSNGIEYIVIHASPGTKETLSLPSEVLNAEKTNHWPLYSLLPSINRVSHYASLGEFSTDPALWPIKFEWDYARRWYLAGNTKAVLPDGPVVRDNSLHTSTYK